MNAPVRIADPAQPRHDWTLDEVEALFELPFTELVFRAAEVHRRWFDPAEVQLSQLLSVKTGGCAENCGYCSQSSHFDTGLKATKLMDADAVIAEGFGAHVPKGYIYAAMAFSALVEGLNMLARKREAARNGAAAG